VKNAFNNAKDLQLNPRTTSCVSFLRKYFPSNVCELPVLGLQLSFTGAFQIPHRWRRANLGVTGQVRFYSHKRSRKRQCVDVRDQKASARSNRRVEREGEMLCLVVCVVKFVIDASFWVRRGRGSCTLSGAKLKVMKIKERERERERERAFFCCLP